MTVTTVAGVPARTTSTPASELAASAAHEWSGLVATAVVGTDRRPPVPPGAGWDAWARASDPAVQVLDRAAAVVTARRAGARPAPPVQGAIPVAPPDPRPPCPPACADRLQRMLGGEHDLLLPEWFERCEQAGLRLPSALLPTLLLRGRRNPQLDRVVRRVAGARASWLADVVPELGVPVAGVPASASSPPFERPGPPPDGGAAVAALVQVFLDGAATWAAAPQLRLVVAGLDRSWLPALVVELSRLAFHAPTQRTRAELTALAEFRAEMLRELDRAAALSRARPAAPSPTQDPGDIA